MLSTLSWAYDFEVDGIYYYFNEDSADVSVARSNNYRDLGIPSSYSGDMVIPSTVTYNNKTYRVRSISYDAFPGCYTIRSVEIPEGMDIELGAFSCSSITSIKIPKGVTHIGEDTFFHCTSLKSVDFPESMIGIWGASFAHCSSLKSIKIPNKVTIIDNESFFACSFLESVEIGESVANIGDLAFYHCYHLTTITCFAENPPQLGNLVFGGDVPVKKATLYVPASAVDKYKAADQWKEFEKILPIEYK